jgi:hypothetical protein
MVHPKTHRDVRRFIVMVNYYRDMLWVLRSELLAPLTSMTYKNNKLNWADEHQKAFENIYKKICREVMLTFPDFSKPFHICIDASDKQLGAVITQDENLLHSVMLIGRYPDITGLPTKSDRQTAVQTQM